MRSLRAAGSLQAFNPNFALEPKTWVKSDPLIFGNSYYSAMYPFIGQALSTTRDSLSSTMSSITPVNILNCPTSAILWLGY